MKKYIVIYNIFNQYHTRVITTCEDVEYLVELHFKLKDISVKIISIIEIPIESSTASIKDF